MSIGYWSIRNPWNTCVAIDEFGAGTLDGNPLHGNSFDACGPAALENAKAGYEKRLPTYSNIGTIRAHMISEGQWTAGASVSNPRTGGCFISNVAWEAAQLEFEVMRFRDYTDALLGEIEIRAALAHDVASTFIVTNAQALAGNESGVHNHFITVAAYGGDNSDGSTGKLYILNSDILGQHGVATGQWTPLAQFLQAEPHGYVVYAPTPPPPVKPPLDAAKIRADLNAIHAAAIDIDSILKASGY